MRIDQLLWLLSIQPWISCTTFSRFDERHCNIRPCYADNLACHNNGSMVECPDAGKLVNAYEFKDQIENYFNKLRNNVAGGRTYRQLLPAARMGKMTWNKELATYAKLDVLRCVVAPRPRICSAKYRNIGRLAEMFAIHDENIDEAVEAILNIWAASVRDLTHIHILNMTIRVKDSIGIQKSALLLIENNTNFGCAALHYTSKTDNFLILSCIFSTTPEEGQRLYKSNARPGSGCRRWDSKYRYLCAKGENYNIEGSRTSGSRPLL